MPIYEYMCRNCGKSFEVLQGINETPELSCEKCNGSDIERVLSPGAFMFKGSGFYETDYKKKPKEQAPPSCGSCEASGGCSSAANDS